MKWFLFLFPGLLLMQGLPMGEGGIRGVHQGNDINGRLAASGYDVRKYKEEIDKVAEDESRLVYYAKVKGVDAPFIIPRRNYINENLEKTIGLLYDKDGKNIIYAVEEILGDMGDFTTDYRHYFDAEGYTLIFERWSGFFHSQCVHNDVLRESEVFYYDKDFKQISRTYSLTRPNGKAVDSMKCDFPYHYEYKKYGTVGELVGSEKLKVKN